MDSPMPHTFYFSPTGTTRRIAAAIARGIAGTAATAETDLTQAPAPAWTAGPETVVILAAPVYGGRIPSVALERMDPLHGNGTPAVIVAVYGNRAFDKAAAELAAWAERHGFRPVAAAAFIGEHSYSSPETPIAAGRPDAEDLAEATAFGERIREKLRRNDLRAVDVRRLHSPRTPLWPMLRFIGFVLAYLWRQRKNPVAGTPVADAERCTGCGRCASLCPTQAIAPGDEQRTDPTRCLRCCACVKGCPAGARTFETPFAAALSRNFSRRKPPVTLL
ncbi:MAG: 4Fe-4S dicluster domain-containing protein [Alistipes sp.]|nr:4Fe-4S dicluster domain-containing protein [Alistipes sp.]